MHNVEDLPVLIIASFATMTKEILQQTWLERTNSCISSGPTLKGTDFLKKNCYLFLHFSYAAILLLNLTTSIN